MQTRKLLTIALSLCCLVLAGCQGEDKPKIAPQNTGQIALPYTEALKQYGITGKTILKKKPERVVCLANTPVLTLFELGVKQVAIPQSRVIQWPKALQDSAKLLEVGMKTNIDIESVIALQPDLVFVGYHGKETYGKILEREKIPVYYVDAGPTVSYDSVKQLNAVLIKAFGEKSEAGTKIEQKFSALEKRMAEQREKNKGKKVLVLQAMPPRYFLQNKKGTIGSMAELLGFTNVNTAEGSGMVMLDQEKALSYNPDLVICVGAMETAQEQEKLMVEAFNKQAAYWYQIKALKDKKVIYLPRSYAVSGGLNVIESINGLIDLINKVEAGENNA